MTGLAQAIAAPGAGWVPSDAFPSPSALADLLETRRQELQLLRIPAFSIRPEPASPPDFSRRNEGLLPFLRKAARRWHRDKAHAEDLVQDTIVRALANAHLWPMDQPEPNLRG